MSAELSAAVGFVSAGVVTLGVTPLAIRVARRTGFYDCPREYRRHVAPTPFLGGAAVLAGFLITAFVIGGPGGRLLVLLSCAVAMWLIGTLDDLVTVPPQWRVIASIVAAIALMQSGFGWDTSAAVPLHAALTVLWIVGVVNAFNLMDNLDGACSTVATVSAAGIGVLAALKGQTTITVLAFALSGACAGFLPWNLAGPAKIFLGDGGSMMIGFLVAALAMAAARHSQAGNAGVLAGAMLVGLAILDTTLVSVSRLRRGVALLTGGRDHLTHRVLLAVRSPRSVAVVLAIAQSILCALAIGGYELGAQTLALLALVAFLSGIVVILVLDTTPWRPPGIAFGAQPFHDQPVEATSARVDSG